MSSKLDELTTRGELFRPDIFEGLANEVANEVRQAQCSYVLDRMAGNGFEEVDALLLGIPIYTTTMSRWKQLLHPGTAAFLSFAVKRAVEELAKHVPVDGMATFVAVPDDTGTLQPGQVCIKSRLFGSDVNGEPVSLECRVTASRFPESRVPSWQSQSSGGRRTASWFLAREAALGARGGRSFRHDRGTLGARPHGRW